MSADVAYLDSSAFVKLVVREPGTAALRRELRRWERIASSALVRAEALRAVRRVRPDAAERAAAMLRDLSLIAIDDDLLERAAAVEPPTLRTLDGIHLASALALGPDLGAMLTYDERLARAARGLGIDVRAPA